MRRSTIAMFMTAITTLASSSAIFAQPPGETAWDQLVQRYANAKTYQAQVTLTVTQAQGRWISTQSTTIPVAINRAEGLLLIDKPEVKALVTGGKLMITSDQIPRRYLELPAPSPIRYSAIGEEISPMVRPVLVDVALLTEDQPLKLIAGNDTAQVTVTPATEKEPMTLTIPANEGLLTITLDEKTGLIAEALLTIDVPAMGGNPEDAMTVALTYDKVAMDQPIADKTFSFDVTGLSKTTDMQTFLAGGGQGGQGGGGGHPLQDAKAPPVELDRMDGSEYELAKDQADVIIYDFWATWCGPCRMALPKLQAVADWAKKNKKSVAIYAVNVGETPDVAKAYWEKEGLTMPVLMDPNNVASLAYGVQGIPQTVVIHDGTVKHVHVGFSETIDSTLKKQIDELLGGGEANEAGETTTEADDPASAHSEHADPSDGDAPGTGGH